MTQHILYTFRRCPYAIRARMALAYAGIECELRELILRDKPADMLKHSPKGTVPVLITNEGEVIDESLDVILWALATSDPAGWLEDQQQSLELIRNSDENFKPFLDRYKYADRYPELTETEHRNLTLPFIEQLNHRLKSSPYLIVQQLRLADIALFPFIRQYAFVDKAWFDQLPYQELQNWLEGLLDADLFKSIMPKFKLFNEGHSYHFPDGELIDH